MHVVLKFIKNTRFAGILTKDTKTSVGQNLGAMVQTGAFYKEKDVCRVHSCREDFCNALAMQCLICEKDHFVMYFMHSYSIGFILVLSMVLVSFIRFSASWLEALILVHVQSISKFHCVKSP